MARAVEMVVVVVVVVVVVICSNGELNLASFVCLRSKQAGGKPEINLRSRKSRALSAQVEAGQDTPEVCLLAQSVLIPPVLQPTLRSLRIACCALERGQGSAGYTWQTLKQGGIAWPAGSLMRAASQTDAL